MIDLPYPSYVTFTIVYQCEGDETHEETVECETFEEVTTYSYHDPDPCVRCQDYGEISYMEIDRIEVVG